MSNNDKVVFIRKQILKELDGINIITDKAINEVISTFSCDDNVSHEKIEKINRNLVVPIRTAQVFEILKANKRFEKRFVDDVIVKSA